MILAGVAGAVTGAMLETIVNRLAGRTIVSQGMMWGTLLAVLLLSLPNFVRMGQLTAKSDKPLVNLLVGVVLFGIISALVIGLIFTLFLLLERLLR